MILKIVDKKSGCFYVDQIHRCYVEYLPGIKVEDILDQHPPVVTSEAKVIDRDSRRPLKRATYRTRYDLDGSPHLAHIVLFNTDAYLLDDTGMTIEKL